MDHPQLTARQAEILDVVIDGIATHHVPPTVREIGEEVGMSSPSSVKYQLDALEEKGYISRNPRRPRMIELTEAGRAHARRSRGDSEWESQLLPTAENGEIVAAMIDGEATVKVLQRRDGHVTLLPCNPAYSPIPADDSEVLGRVVMVLRTL